MNEAIAIAGLFIIVIGWAIGHAAKDIEIRTQNKTEIENLKKRVSKLDGINGNH